METTIKPQSAGATAPLLSFVGAGLAGFALVHFGLPLLGAIEHGVGTRVGIAIVAGLFTGSIAALIARGRGMAALADAALTQDASPELIRHRARRTRARWSGFGVALVGTGVGYLAVGLRYASLNEERHAWEQLEAGALEAGVAAFVALALGALLWRFLDPGLFVEDEESYVPTGDATTVSDDELERTAAAVRAHQRRSTVARIGGVMSAVGVMSLLGYGAGALEISGGEVWLFIFACGVAAGAVFNRVVGPKVSIDEIGIDDAAPEAFPTGDGAASVSFDERLGTAKSLRVSRRSGWMSLFVDGGRRSYHLSADDTALAEGARTRTWLDRLLPAFLAPFRAQITEADTTLDVLSQRLTAHFSVREAGVLVGTIDGAPLSRAYTLRAGDQSLRLEGSFWNRREFALRQDGERVGYVQVSRAGGALESLLSGREVSLRLELPSDTSPAFRRLLLALMLVVDERHF